MRRKIARRRLPLIAALGVMSEFELFEALMISVELSVLASMNFLAIMITYIVAAYVAGKELPTSIVIGTSIIYTMFLLPALSGVFGNLRRAYEIGSVLTTNFPDSPLALGANISFEAVITFTCIPLVAGWLGSLYYMHSHVRGNHGQDA